MNRLKNSREGYSSNENIRMNYVQRTSENSTNDLTRGSYSKERMQRGKNVVTGP